MNHTIIKKALNEALTQKYYDELMSGDDEEHIFSVGFTADMKRLIRKTDDKLLYYSKYVAIAACACIAVGCAVLLPNLINSGIRTEPVITTAVTEIATPPDETTLPIIITTPEDTTTTTLDTDSEDTLEIITTETTTPPVITDETTSSVTTTETTTTPVTTTEEKVTGTTTTPADTYDEIADDADADGDLIVDDDAETDGDVVVDDDNNSDSAPDVEEGDDDVEIEDDSDDTVVEEDDCEIEDDEDVSTDVDDDVEVEEEDDVVEDEDYPEELKTADVSNLGEGIGFFMWDDKSAGLADRLYANGVTVSRLEFDDGEERMFANDYLSPYYLDLDFTVDYILSQKNAPKTEPANINHSADYITIHLSDMPISLPAVRDSSWRNDYETYYGENSSEEYVADEEDYMGNEINVKVLRDGYVSISMYGYKTVYFDVDDTVTAELFAKFDNSEINKTPATVSELISIANLTGENINTGLMSINSLYDINLSNAPITDSKSKKQLAELINALGSCKLSTNRPEFDSFRRVSVKFGLKDKPNVLDITVSGTTLVISDGTGNQYYGTVPESAAEGFITLACKAAGVASPYFYKDFSDYLNNVAKCSPKNLNYSTVADGYVWNYRLPEDKMADFNKFAADYFSKTVYSTSADTKGAYNNMKLRISENTWASIYENDVIRILNNYFKAPDGFFKSVLSYMEKSGSVQKEAVPEDSLVDVDTDDFEIDEEIAIED
ncbi:MAG: hypothetical protein IKK42_07895 [Oscillospiraceae bacterium]|nr:hypothetical protein [Oscillospiraceae bacterium]